jgi:hypothetical protein
MICVVYAWHAQHIFPFTFFPFTFFPFTFFPTMSNLTFRANTCDHMIYDGACDCNERRIEGEPDFLTTIMEEVAEVVPRSLFRNPDGPAEIVEYDPRPTQMDLAIIGSMAFCGIRASQRREAGIDSSETDNLELTASMNVAQHNPTLLHGTDEFLCLFNAEIANLMANVMIMQSQVEEHLEDVRLVDEAEQARLREYMNDVADDNDGNSYTSAVEEQAYLDACDACSYGDDSYDDGHRSPDNYGESNYYDEGWTGYEGNDW